MAPRSAVGPSRGLQMSFDDLGLALAEVTFCVVDLETTGSGDTDAITEIGAVKVRGGEVLGEFATLVNPHSAIPPLVAVLTGITNRMVAAAPRLAEVLPAYLAFAEGTVLVAHNAPFDAGFLRRACAEQGYPWPRWPVVDTAALARSILLRDEVPNRRLATLARHFHSATVPNHRALTDARATVDVLHGLIERVGNLGVHTLEDLREFARSVAPARRAKRTWARELPTGPGVYLFVAEHGDQRSVLYVGKSVNLRARVGSYFTAAERRSRIEEMVRLATGVETVPCLSALQAEVTELRLIAAHAPRYNRRSKFPQRQHWIKITAEPFPRLSVVRTVADDGATYFGPFSSRRGCEDVLLAIYEGFPIRQCTTRLRPGRPASTCALADLGRCSSPCDGRIDRAGYARIVEQVRGVLAEDPAPALVAARARLERLVADQRYEEAGVLTRRLEALVLAARRFHRIRSLAACPEIVAACRAGEGWEIHVVRFGRLAGTAVAGRHDVPQAVARAVQRAAETVPRPPGPCPGGSVEEAERIADWLERPGVRLIDVRGDWMWPLHAVVDCRAVLGGTLERPLDTLTA